MITALKLLREAAALGWTFGVDQGDDALRCTALPNKAWRLVKEVEEANVVFYDADSQRVGVAYLMAPGLLSCSDEETLVDYSSREGSPFSALCDRLIEEAV